MSIKLHRCSPTWTKQDGKAYRAESKEMAARIRDGKLFADQRGTSAGSETKRDRNAQRTGG